MNSLLQISNLFQLLVPLFIPFLSASNAFSIPLCLPIFQKILGEFLHKAFPNGPLHPCSSSHFTLYNISLLESHVTTVNTKAWLHNQISASVLGKLQGSQQGRGTDPESPRWRIINPQYSASLACHSHNRGWGGWMASLTQWTWVWASSQRQWRTGKPGMLQSMGSQRVGHDWATEKQQQVPFELSLKNHCCSHTLSMQRDLRFSELWYSPLCPPNLWHSVLYTADAQ